MKKEINVLDDMILTHNMQINGLIPNPFKIPFDDVDIIVSSNEKFLIAISELIPNDKYCYLRCLFIKEEYRLNGFGTQIMKILIDDCIEKNIHSIELESENNSLNFFKKLGFKLNGENNNRMVLNF
jgi:N-acetylglutamate synthase-like GNAT family acetyltransferase